MRSSFAALRIFCPLERSQTAMSTQARDSNPGPGTLRWKVVASMLIILVLVLSGAVLNLKTQLDAAEQHGEELRAQLGDCVSQANTTDSQVEALNTEISNCKSQLDTT